MGFDSFYNSEQQVTKSSGEWNRKMKTAIAILISSLSLGLFAYVQGEQEGEEPLPAKASTQSPIITIPDPSPPLQVQELLKLREKVGGQLNGRLLEEDPSATQNDFEEALEKVRRESGQTDAHLAPAVFNAPELPFDIPVTENSPSTAVDKLPYMLRYTSMSLENHAGLLELQKDFENALKLRKQAKKIRKMAFEVESLTAESKTISVEQ